LTNPSIYTLHHRVRRRPRPAQGPRADGDDDNIVAVFVNYAFALKIFVSSVLPVLISVPFHDGISTGGTPAPHILTFGQRWR
jgi:hypothetical protein